MIHGISIIFIFYQNIFEFILIHLVIVEIHYADVQSFILQSKQEEEEEEEATDLDKVDKKWLDAYVNRTKFFEGMSLPLTQTGQASFKY